MTSQGTYTLWESAEDRDGTQTLSGGGTKSTTDDRSENARNGTTRHMLTGSDVYTLYGSETPVSGTTTLATTADGGLRGVQVHCVFAAEGRLFRGTRVLPRHLSPQRRLRNKIRAHRITISTSDDG